MSNSNSLEIRRVVIRTVNATGGFTETETFEFRTKDVTASVLGLVPLASAWSTWTKFGTITVVQDQQGNIIG